MNIGLIGCGFIGFKHLEVAAKLKEVQLTAVSDLLPERMEEAVQLYTKIQANDGISPVHVEKYHSYKDLLKNSMVDAVVIATISGYHSQIAKDALLQGKHVIIEKPLSLSLAEAEEIIRIGEEQGLKIAVCHQKRFLPHLGKIREYIQAGAIGKLLFAGISLCYNRDEQYFQSAAWRGTWEFDGGLLINQAIHDIDLLNWLVGNPKFVTGHISRMLKNTETEDTAMAIFKLVNDELVRIEATISANKSSTHERLIVIGTKGSFSLTGKYFETIEQWQVEQWNVPLFEAADLYESLYKDFVSAIRDDREPFVSGQDGLRTLETILAIYRSVYEGKRIELPMQHFSTSQLKNLNL